MSRSLLEVIRPFQGRHNPLRGGWSDDQLQVVAGALKTNNLTAAAIACSLIAELRTTATPVRYSRSQKTYKSNEVFQGDPLMTYRRVVPGVDWLIDQGYAAGTKGSWLLSKQSILAATPKLTRLISDLVDVSRRVSATLKDEIVLRDKDGHSIGFCDTDEIRRMRHEMNTINALLSDQRYFLGESQLYIPPAARIFNQSFRRGGRLYHQGSSYQQMSKAKRAKIEMVIEDGLVSPMVERDFESLHMALIYRLARKHRPDGDLYAIEGFSRKLVKKGCLIAINADGTEVGALAGLLDEDEDLCWENGIDHNSPSAMRLAAEQLIAAIKRKHYRVMEYFGSGAGAELMRTDSDMAVQVMLSMIEKTGRCPLVVHDSFLVPSCDVGHLDDAMAKALLEASSKSNTLPLPIHLGKHGIDQQECEDTRLSDGTGNTPRLTEMLHSAPERTPWSSASWEQRRNSGSQMV